MDDRAMSPLLGPLVIIALVAAAFAVSRTR